MQGLGLEYCKQLIGRSCSLLVVASRRGSLPLDVLHRNAASASTTFAIQNNARCIASTGARLQWVQETLPYVQHFAHAAGVSDFSLIQDMGETDFRGVAEVKVLATGASSLLVGLHCTFQSLRLGAHCRSQQLARSKGPRCHSNHSLHSHPPQQCGVKRAQHTMQRPMLSWTPIPVQASWLACQPGHSSMVRLQILAWLLNT